MKVFGSALQKAQRSVCVSPSAFFIYFVHLINVFAVPYHVGASCRPKLLDIFNRKTCLFYRRVTIPNMVEYGCSGRTICAYIEVLTKVWERFGPTLEVWRACLAHRSTLFPITWVTTRNVVVLRQTVRIEAGVPEILGGLGVGQTI